MASRMEDEDTYAAADKQDGKSFDAASSEIVGKGASNPLLVELVLRKIFELLPSRDLKSCRLVNSTWKNLTTPYLKRKCTYISFNNDNYWTDMKNHKIEDMSRFITCVNASTSFPFTKLDIGTSVIHEPERDEPIVTDFFQRISQWATEITIRDEWGQKLFSSQLPEKHVYPSLEFLTLHFIQHISDDVEVNNIFQFIANIMEHSPSLKKLILVDHNGMDGKAVDYFIDAIQRSGNLKFTSLQVAAQIEDNHLTRLASMGLKLQSLNLDFWGSVLHENNLKIFLESQTNSVEMLKISDYAMSSNFVVNFPLMKKLKTLKIKGSVLGRICVTFPNVCYRSQLPALKRLSFTNSMDEWDEFLKYGIQPVESVEELKLPSDFADEDSLHHAVRIFPNIKKLEISAIINIVNIVYESMPNLEELILNTQFVDLIDDIITGLTLSECEAVTSFSEKMFRKVERDHLQLVTTKPLSCLKRLKILRLKCKRQSDPVELTDVSCRLVLMKMESLETLDFWYRYPCETRVTDHTLSQMRKKFLVLC